MRLPDDFIKRLDSQEYVDPGSLIEALGKPSPVSIRINRSKWNKKPVSSLPVQWCKEGFYLEKRPSFTLDPLFHAGCYYPQEASGMFLCEIFKQIPDLQKSLKVLDLCGAPGGKSTHISSLIGPGSLLVSNEVIRSRAYTLAENITKWGKSNTVVTQNDPADFAKLPGFFDAILVDAPCSGEGMFRDPVAVNEWSEDNTLLCSERQKRILMDVWPALKGNGILIYSTCTFNPGENEKNIEWFLEKKKADIVRIDVSGYEGITEISGNGVTGYGFYPDRIKGEGFFVSVLRKRDISSERMIYINKKNDISLQKNDLLLAEKLINVNDCDLVRYGDTVFKIAGEINGYQIIKQNLRIISPGTKLFTLKNTGYLPAHELALSCELKDDAFPVVGLDYTQAAAYLRRENLKITVNIKGWFIMAYKGVKIGFAKDIGNRINNYFPVNWRIRIRGAENDHERLIDWE
jgi:16S rRNA C967 or C1407 C5-methylase (RsmB/RsmF family)/NOL1/NOP2/fmu family ribosome biogenesis protein